MDSRSETDNRSEFIQGSEQREIMKACFHFRVARESRKFSIEDIKFTMKSLILAQDER